MLLGVIFINRPFYLQNLLGESNPRDYTISLARAGEVNGVQFQGFDAAPLVTANINELQEWTISNTGGHPWHMHVSQYLMCTLAKELVTKNLLYLFDGWMLLRFCRLIICSSRIFPNGKICQLIG